MNVAIHRLYVVLLVGMVVFCRSVAFTISPIYDDAFITFRYARNLAEGYGLVYNVGEQVLGTTTPGYAVLVALAYLLHLPMPAAAVLFNILLDGALVWLTILLFERAQEAHQHLSGVVFAAFWALSPTVARITVGGMETNLFLLLVVGTLACCYYCRRFWISIPLATLACFTRPEGLLLFLITVFLSLRRGVKATVVALTTSALIAGMLLLLMFFYYGSIIPQSVRAKVDLTGDRTALEVLAFFLKDRLIVIPVPLETIAIPLAILGLPRLRKGSPAIHVVLLWALLYSSTYLIVRPAMWEWYRLPVLYGMYVLGALGFATVVSRLRLPLFQRIATFMAISVFLFWSAIGIRVVLGHSDESERVKRVMYSIKHFCAKHDLSKSTVLAGDIGFIGYYSRARIIDIHGLTWPDYDKFDKWSDVAKAYQPEYLFLVANRGNVEQLVESGLDSLYRPVARFSEHGYKDTTLDPRAYEEGWRPDYLLLERIRDDSSWGKQH